jgi:cytochrome c oxidase subunit 2
VDFTRQFRLLPESASTTSGQTDAIVWFLTAISVLMTLVVFLLVVYFAIRYRRRTENEIPPETRDHTWLEIGWSSALFGVFMFTFFWASRVYVTMKRPAVNALQINVVGKQWMWKIQHPGGQREIDELHVPVGRPIKLVMISQDVIHSFGVPAFRFTQDVLPGSYTTQSFTATRTGDYLLECREYCGTQHSGMIGRVIVMQPQDYEAWLAGKTPDDTPAIAGWRLFVSYGCIQCHGQNAPTLAGLYGRHVKLDDGSIVTADESYLRESILNPPARVVSGYPRLMPSLRGLLSEEQITDLIAYIKTLGASQADEAAGTVRTDVAAPATRPVNGLSPNQIPDQPPARQPPGVLPPPPRSGGAP